mgnify:CR=1 FL=1
MKKVDLHIHTTASDGQYSPTEIIEKAASKKMAAIAITDHDNIEGLEEVPGNVQSAGRAGHRAASGVRTETSRHV